MISLGLLQKLNVLLYNYKQVNIGKTGFTQQFKLSKLASLIDTR